MSNLKTEVRIPRPLQFCLRVYGSHMWVASRPRHLLLYLKPVADLRRVSSASSLDTTSGKQIHMPARLGSQRDFINLFSARLAFLRGFDSLRWYHYMHRWQRGPMQWIANPQNREFESHPVFQCPGRQIGKVVSLKKRNLNVGSTPTRGTKSWKCGWVWLKAAVLKTEVPKGAVGSNPTTSANLAA